MKTTNLSQFVLIGLLICIATADAFAQPFFISGSGSWSNPNNWSNGSVPDLGDDPNLIPVFPDFPDGVWVTVSGSPPTPCNTDVRSSILNVSGTLVIDQILNVTDDSLISISGTLESRGIWLRDSSLQLNGGTLIGRNPSGNISFVNSTITRTSTSRISADIMDVLDGTDVQLLTGDVVKDLEVNNNSSATLTGILDLDFVSSSGNGNITIAGETSVENYFRINSNSTLRLNSGRLTADSIELTDGGGAADLIQNGGNFTTEYLRLSGGQQVVIGESDEVNDRIEIDNGTRLEILKPLQLGYLPNSLFVLNSDLIYRQPVDSQEGLDVAWFTVLSTGNGPGTMELILNRSATTGLVWGIRVPNNRQSLLQPLLDDRRVFSNGPVEVIYDPELYGDFTYIGFVSEDELLLGDL
ncbi:MAG: hypothetical protein AAGA30_04050, partial [Planctomycetota bacterium]